MKIRKILSLALVAALLCSIALTGAVSADASAVIKEDGNYLLNGSFELAETKEEGTLYGFKDYCINHGNIGVLVDNWMTFNWLNGNSAANPNIKVTHTTDAHSGDYALYFDIPYSNTHYVYPAALAVDTLPAGNYRLSAWVKGTNSASTINVTDADGNVKSVNVVASEDWTQISIDGISSIGTTIVGSKDGKNIEVIGITITPKKGDVESYFIIDDIRLEAVEAEVEYLTGGGLDTSDKLWNSATGKSGMTGYTNFTLTNGQHNQFVDGWRYQTYGSSAETRIALDHTTDSHNGNYAVKANIQVGDAALTLCPDVSSINTASITEGYYTFSVWVKSTNNSANTKLEVKSTVPDSDTAKTYTATVTAGEEWHQINLYDVYLTDGAANVAAYNSHKHIKLILTADTTDTYVIFDDFALTKQDVFYNGSMEIKGKSDTNVTANGQANPNTILQGYTAQDWSGKKTTYDIVDDAHSGDKALKITFSSAGTVYSRYDGSDIQPGTYKFSVWAKGNATKAILRAYQAKVETPTTEEGGSLKKNFYLENLSETEWKYYEFVFTIAEGYTIKRALEQNQTSVYLNALGFGINGGTAGEYAIFDDIKFEKVVANAEEAAAEIIGIQTPAVNETKLTLPAFGPHITVAIVASSDESIVALDGTITPAAGRNFVDITLEVSDGKNTVTLEPIGVVIPGTSQVAIDDVKREIKLLPNGNAANPILPIHSYDIFQAREKYNALSAEAQAFVTNVVVLGQRENTVAGYGAVLDTVSLSKDGQLRVKAAYPTKFTDGYTVKEYGMLFIPTALAENENITLDTPEVSASVMNFVPTEADTYFYSVLKDSALENHKDTEILMRSYVTYEYVENDETKTVTVYSRFTVKSSVADLIAQ